MTIKHAEQATIPFGKYRGLSIGQVSGMTGGLEYLAWMGCDCEIRNQFFKAALTAFLNDPAVMEELELERQRSAAERR